VAAALGTDRIVEWPQAEQARAAAFLVTGAEGGALHLADLRTRALEFDPMTRDRFIAGALLPAAWVVQAQRVRRWAAQHMAGLLREVDVLLRRLRPARRRPSAPNGWRSPGSACPPAPAWGC
jgi:amidase/aspartyl-tRNA(Asn)/glutamyl-tRNA(Gln) amidotransferase subunit A